MKGKKTLKNIWASCLVSNHGLDHKTVWGWQPIFWNNSRQQILFIASANTLIKNVICSMASNLSEEFYI